MRCTGCGNNIPFGGQVCPYCQRDKSSDQTGTVMGVVAMIVGGTLGNLLAGFGGMIVVAFIFGLIAAIISQAGKKHSTRKPPIVRVERTTPPSVPKPVRSTAPSVEERLRTLDDLRSKALITDTEYEKRRMAILETI